MQLIPVAPEDTWEQARAKLIQNFGRIEQGDRAMPRKKAASPAPSSGGVVLPENLEVTNGVARTKVNVRFDRLRVGPHLIERKWTDSQAGTKTTTMGRRRILPGTATWVQNDPTVTGTGTAFLTDFGIGDSITLTNHIETRSRPVVSIASDTALDVDTNWANSAPATAAAYHRNGRTTNPGFNLTADYAAAGANGLDMPYANLTGTVQTAVSTALVGTNTLFTTELQVGDLVRVASSTVEVRRITAIASNTAATLNANCADAESGCLFSKRNWLAVYVITNEVGDRVASLLSASFESPRMPPGFSFSRRVGAVRFADTTTNVEQFYRFSKVGDWWWWNETPIAAPFLVLATQAAVATTWTNVVCTGAAPSTSGLLDLQFWSWPAGSGGASNLQFRGNNQANVGVNFTAPYISSWVGSTGWTSLAAGLGGRGLCLCDSSQVIEYYAQVANMDISASVLAYYDPI